MLNRRHLIRMTAALAGTALLPGSGQTAHLNRFISLLDNPEAACALGLRCAGLLPDDSGTLQRLAGFSAMQTNAEALAREFAAKRQADFLHGRVHTVDGWVMAEAECALCRLLANT